MTDWKHDPNGGDIISQVRNAPDYVKEYAAQHLLSQGCPHRHIRKKLDISARQFQMMVRKFRFNSRHDPVHIPTSILPPE